jgi:hypothetical protein
VLPARAPDARRGRGHADSTTLWLLFPLAVLLAGLAPAVISFAAGQAAFTITLLILYNIIAPAGWKVGLVRIEDVAIGCAVSLVVGALFWPRGAGAAFGQAASEAYAGTARYLRAAVMFGVVRCDRRLPATPVPREESLHAAAAARRLDDAFRGFLAERGTKQTAATDHRRPLAAVRSGGPLSRGHRAGAAAPPRRTAP